ncbi:hypothetical protein C449_01256 [Halococcus saccharolyticus DSM 5350]|uniref:Cox cluster protein n=2 Tax=Halococcus saccharolyticus TaxID=62319 RepID=M0MPJ4_9EURY|nr:hypothetical protein C449_01256 [Halococcus saccharolyticus DSM 5350]
MARTESVDGPVSACLSVGTYRSGGYVRSMAERVFDRETLLDLTVNFIPLGMLLFFILLFAGTTVGGPAPVARLVSQALLVVPFVALVGITYFTGRIIAESERTGHSETARAITALVTGEEPDEDEG